MSRRLSPEIRQPCHAVSAAAVCRRHAAASFDATQIRMRQTAQDADGRRDAAAICRERLPPYAIVSDAMPIRLSPLTIEAAALRRQHGFVRFQIAAGITPDTPHYCR